MLKCTILDICGEYFYPIVSYPISIPIAVSRVFCQGSTKEVFYLGFTLSILKKCFPQKFQFMKAKFSGIFGSNQPYASFRRILKKETNVLFQMFDDIGEACNSSMKRKVSGKIVGRVLVKSK